MNPAFETFAFEHAGQERTVYQLPHPGAPGVLLLQELPGLTPHTLDLAQRLHDDGFTVYLPHLFGRMGEAPSIAGNLLDICIRREFAILFRRKTSVFTEWLRALARHVQAQTARPVGAIGMCLTGGFALSLIIDDAVAAPVATQPAHLGLAWQQQWKSKLGLDADDESRALACAAKGKTPFMAMRFKDDPMCPKERFDRYQEIFGERMVRVELDTPPVRTQTGPPHSVLTLEYDPTPGSNTRAAYEQMVAYFRQHLGPTPA